MITKSLKDHGLIKTCVALAALIGVLCLLILMWQVPEIIRAIQGR